MKVLNGVAASIVVAVGLLAVPRAKVAAATAECPSECRREIGEVLCFTISTADDDGVRTARYYWSDGPEA